MKAARNAGRPPPPKFFEIEEKTKPWMAFFISAFYELSTERPASFGPGPIPWSKIIDFGRHYGYSGVNLEVFKDVIRKMDAHYLKQAAEKTKEPIKK